VFGAFGFVGMVAGITDPLADSAVAVVASLIAAGTGAITLALLLLLLEGRVAVRPSERPVAATATGGPAIEHPTDPHTDRRAFFGWTGGLAAFAVLSAAGGRRLRGESVAESARAEVVLREPRRSELTATGADLDGEAEGLSSFITPNDDFYRIDTAIIVPQVDPANWSLTITGMVDTPVTIGYDELLDLATVETTITMACVSNSVGGDLIGNAVWQGVALGDLLDRAGVQDGADQIVGRSVDDFTVGFPTEVAFDGRPALVAVGMNGEPLPIEHGFPARLVVSGLYGYVSATKWLSEIELTTWDSFDSYWVPRGWSKSGPVKTQSRIDVPRDGASVEAGDRRIAGVAWAPHRGIDEVEVQVDDGSWTKATLGDPLAGDTWRQWVVEWEAQPGRHTVRVRATDSDGETQTVTRTPVDPDGATGWHSITVVVDD
jgi:DMSO/TMAO reductase YedYZ molybdopterin-dependent catalytic subunit